MSAASSGCTPLGMCCRRRTCSAAALRTTSATAAKDATLDEVKRAAAMVRADRFIEALPDGYGTEVGEGGGRLSTGQKAACGSPAWSSPTRASSFWTRGYQLHRHRDGTAHPERHPDGAGRAHQLHRGAPPVHHPQRGQDPCHPRRAHHRGRHPRRAAGAGRILLQPVHSSVPRRSHTERLRGHKPAAAPLSGARAIPTGKGKFEMKLQGTVPRWRPDALSCGVLPGDAPLSFTAGPAGRIAAGICPLGALRCSTGNAGATGKLAGTLRGAGFSQWAVTLRESGTLAGVVNLHGVDEAHCCRDPLFSFTRVPRRRADARSPGAVLRFGLHRRGSTASVQKYWRAMRPLCACWKNADSAGRAYCADATGKTGALWTLAVRRPSSEFSDQSK